MKLTQQYQQRLVQKIDPRMIMANSMLQLSSMELTQLVEQELSDNPALEVEEDLVCPRCNAPMEGVRCANCGFSFRDAIEDVPEVLAYEYGSGGSFEEDDEYDPFARVEAVVSLQEHLRLQLRAVGTRADYPIGDCILCYINDDGYLEDFVPADVAVECGTDERRVLQVLQVIQSLDPPGVGARTLQECLRIQLRSDSLLEDVELETAADRREFLRIREIAIGMVEGCWDELCSQKYPDIARRLRIEIEDAQDAHAFIQRHLNPYPGRAFRPDWAPNAGSTRDYVKPDVIVRKKEDEFEVLVVESSRFVLRVNEFYRTLHREMQRNKEARSGDERQHTAQYVERAELFIRNLNQRKRTLHTITTSLVNYQIDYFDTADPAKMRPLTRGKLAALLGVHESTVSRATANKYLQLPWQEVTGYDFFFDASLSVKELIRDIIISEDEHAPFSDQTIAELLQERYGVEIARRTVEKYRDEMKILSSRKRRKRQ